MCQYTPLFGNWVLKKLQQVGVNFFIIDLRKVTLQLLMIKDPLVIKRTLSSGRALCLIIQSSR